MAELWRQPEKCRKSAAWQWAWPQRGSRTPFGLLSGFFLAISRRVRARLAARAVCGDGAAVRETDSLQFALYFQPGSEAAGREDKVLQRRGEQRLRLRHENHVILQIDRL